MIKTVFVFDPTQNSSGFANPDNRHLIICRQITGFNLIDHISFDYRTNRKEAKERLDNYQTLMIAHMSDIEDDFILLKTIKNATVICHTDKWDYSNPFLDVRIIENMKNKNYHLTGSQKVKDNIGAFVNHIKSSGKIDFEIIEGFITDEN